ncbi:MAG: helix-turn-helix domain-containing protein [Chthoniobacteraceae bacterium]
MNPKSLAVSIPPPALEDYSSEPIFAMTALPQAPRPAHPEHYLHYHRHYELLYITKGVRELWVEGREYRAEAGDLIVFRPGEAHGEYAGTRTISFFVYRFRPEELSNSHLEFPRTRNRCPVLNLPQKAEFVALFNRICAEFALQEPDSQMMLGAYLVEFIVKLRRAVRGSATKKPESNVRDQIRLAASLLQENVSAGMALEKLARRTFMSTSHFAHSFKACVGESPRRYQIHERIEQAKVLLLETAKPATEIAQQLGYTSPYFFYRQFRKKTGYTTAQFRERFNPA